MHVCVCMIGQSKLDEQMAKDPSDFDTGFTDFLGGTENAPSTSSQSHLGSFWNVQSQFGFPSWPPTHASDSSGSESLQIEVKYEFFSFIHVLHHYITFLA